MSDTECIAVDFNNYEYTPELHQKRMEQMAEVQAESLGIYNDKNPRYGDSFVKGMNDEGLVSVKTRLTDKYLRFKQLVDHPEFCPEGVNSNIESIEDTLFDMANYSHMALAYIRESRANKGR